MSGDLESGTGTSKPRHRFMTTRWTLVRSAHHGDDSESSRHALGELCEMYWYPLYAFTRRRGAQVADAQEQVQEFFTELLGGSFFSKADEEKGKFRSFLLKSFSNFLSDERRRENAMKRQGGRLHYSIDMTDGESRYQIAPVDNTTPAHLFERQWAMTILDVAISRLCDEYSKSGKTELFDRLVPHLTQEAKARPYAEIAESLALNETAVKVAAYRMRKRYRAILRSEISETIQGESETDVDEELRWLVSTLSR